jgi:CheY-like chemotaxis protein
MDEAAVCKPVTEDAVFPKPSSFWAWPERRSLCTRTGGPAMTCKALVVSDDSDLVNDIADALTSLGHDYDIAINQTEAIKRLKATDFDYMLSDISIQARSHNGHARIQNTENMLDQMAGMKLKNTPPVILMSDYATSNAEETVEVMRLAKSMHRRGVVDFVAKPLVSKGRTLDRVIKKFLSGKTDRVKITWPEAAEPTAADHGNGNDYIGEEEQNILSEARRTLPKGHSLVPFSGGVLAYHPRHIEFCGEIITEKSRRGYAWQILQVLRKTNDHDKYVHLGSRALARKLNPEPEQNTLIRSVCSLRARFIKIARTRLGYECGQEDVIAKDDQGYYLSDGIVVEVYDEDGTLTNQPDDTGKNSSKSKAEKSSLILNEKQRWIMDKLTSEGKMTRREVEQEFNISDRTAKRVLGELSDAGLIVFDRSTHPGFYRLK